MKGFKKKILRALGLHHLADFLRKIRFFHYRYHFPYIKAVYKKSSVTKKNVSSIDGKLFSRLLNSLEHSINFSPSGMWGSIFN